MVEYIARKQTAGAFADRLMVVADGETLTGDGWTLTAVATPGHTSNHLCYALAESGALFSGDHVMGWSTTIVAPPDGDMAAYMASLAKLHEREDRVYYPAHGPAVDKRIFQVNPSTPDTPSLDPSENQNDSIKNRAIGRKRNGFGKALGDIVLKDGQSVESLTASSIRQAFVEKGYTIITNKDQIGKDTFVVDANIEKFWAWMNPGFASITLSTEISTELDIKSPLDNSKEKIYVKAADSFQLGTESNWIEVINQALRLYVDDLKSKLK